MFLSFFSQRVIGGGIRLLNSGDLVNVTLNMDLIDVLRERYWGLDNSTGIIIPNIRTVDSFLEDECGLLSSGGMHTGLV